MSFAAGDIVFSVTIPGSDRERLADFSEGTEDPNPIHLDESFAQKAGFPTVLQQGPMTTAHFARILSDTIGQENLRWLDVNFTAPVFPDEPLTLTATVIGVESGVVTCTLAAAKEDGTVTANAEAGFSA